MIRIAFTVHGQVQGVGFRPHIWRLAREEKLTGSVGNTSAGVRIEVQGASQALEAFGRRLRQELPPLARITRLEQQELPVIPLEDTFSIRSSHGHGGQNVLVSADVSVCADCLADMRNPANRRHNYPFTNCTNCGPRFSITKSIPYDRAVTTMACFPLCDACAAEYSNPADRRFHAQPIACPECGPRLWFVSRNDAKAGYTGPNADNMAGTLEKAGKLLKDGDLVALRGLGGFQLACDACNADAVAKLRHRKNRPHKALAVMMRSLTDAARWCDLSPQHEALLTGAAKPVVLCPMKQEALPILGHIAPDSLNLGIMLPYTPLHALLLDWLAANGMNRPCLVMTSANPRGEPIVLGNREALDRLDHLADAWLLHDRDILCRIDDSVVEPGDSGPIFIRRARGYVPEPTPLPGSGPCVLGTGAELKATFCLTRGANGFPGQHIGDLAHMGCADFYEEALAHLQRLLEVRPEMVVHDLHPDFLTTRFARELASRENIPACGLQHHAAHAAACLAEHGIMEPALALCLDGSGLGTDGRIWGGELLLMDLARPQWRRLGALTPFLLPGGEAAIREPWRIAAALHWLNKNENWSPAAEEQKIAAICKARVNCPETTSCGRLFDAVSAQLGLCRAISYEAQAALRLEKEATLWQRQNGRANILDAGFCPTLTGDFLQLDTGAIFAQIGRWQLAGASAGQIALAFHGWMANGFARMAAQAADTLNVRLVAMSGGVMHNALLREMLERRIRALGLTPLSHRNPGDGGLSLGQAFWGQRLLAAGLESVHIQPSTNAGE